MDPASLAEIKKTLMLMDRGELLDACLRLARFKKDNKELLTYMLFLSKDEQGKETEVQVRMHFCQTLRDSETPFRKHRVMWNMYAGQIKKIRKAGEKFHDDVKRDLERDISKLETFS